jgi:hypothetical protein
MKKRKRLLLMMKMNLMMIRMIMAKSMVEKGMMIQKRTKNLKELVMAISPIQK